MDMASISSALGALRLAVDFTKTAVGIRDDDKIAEATKLLNDRIIDVQNAALNLQEKLSTQRDDIEALKDAKRELSTQIAEFEKRQSEREKYQLCELTPGSFVLASIPASDDSGPMHYICQPCMDNATKTSVLQDHRSGGKISLHCTLCKSHFSTGRSYQIQGMRIAGF